MRSGWKLLVFLCVTGCVCAAANPGLLCSIERPVAEVGESVRLKVWVVPSSREGSPPSWSVDQGRLQDSASGAVWILDEVSTGRHIARVKAKKLECSVQLYVVTRTRGGRETGRGYLVPDQPEKPGYGLYSYFLLGSPPDETSRERYLKALEAHLRISPALDRLAELLDPKQINATYLLVDTIPRGNTTPEWILEHYDYARARVILRALPGVHLHGPYLVSGLAPAGAGAISQPYLYQDLSFTPPSLVGVWYEEFLNQVAQDHFWETRTGPQFVLKLRTTIGVLALGLPDVQKSLDGWLKWVK